MANPFETVILNMRGTGIFQFLLPWMLSTAIFFGLLRKSQIFGEPERTTMINAVVAIVAAFMVWSAPILLGIDMETKLSAFFVQGTSATLVVLLGLMIVSMFFPPDLPKQLGVLLNAKGPAGGVLIFGILIAAGILISSGLIGVILPGFSLAGLGGTGGIGGDTVSTVLMVALLLGTVLIIAWGGGKGDSK
jgi:hypothetical protein